MLAEGCAPHDRSVVGEDSQALIISTPSRAVSVAACTRSGEVRTLRASFIDGQGTAFQGLSIQPGNCPPNAFAIAKFNKSETSGGSGYLVAHHSCGGYLETRVGRKFAEQGIGGALWQIAYEKFGRHISLFGFVNLVWPLLII
jgi:hypothetical protein